MRKFLFVISLFLMVFSLFGQQEPLMKIYMDDGSTKQYHIDTIANLSFIHSNLSYSMSVFQKGNLKTDYDIRNIDSILYDNKQEMKIIISGDTKTFNISEIDSIIFIFNTCIEIQIGTQIWMCKNLNVDHYRNGDAIPEVKDSAIWVNLKTGAWCYYNNDPAMGKIYGKLYNWYAVNDSRGLPPNGWHISSDEEWSQLGISLGGDSVAGCKIKEIGTTHWQSPNTWATNSSGFSALPGGFRAEEGLFFDVGGYGEWWTSTELNATSAWYRTLGYDIAYIFRYGISNTVGLSVRCIKDK